MFVPDQIRKAVAFLAIPMANDMARLVGTCFFLSRYHQGAHVNFGYVVTAKHIVDGVRNKGVTELLIRYNTVTGGSAWMGTALKDWESHPTDTAADVALIRLILPEDADFLLYPIDRCATDAVIKSERIGVGEEVFLVGLFRNHYGQNRNIPLVRVGNIAAMPEEPVTTRLGPAMCYLIEARSLGGLSGSPVFVNLGQIRVKNGEILRAQSFDPVFHLLGLVHGHWDQPAAGLDSIDDPAGGEKINVGIAIVTPAQKIIDIINAAAIKEAEEAIAQGIISQGDTGHPQADAQ